MPFVRLDTAWDTDVRFAPYLDELGGNRERAVALYIWNTRISAAMFETLHHIEVLLRNAIDGQFAPVDAAESPRDTWLEDPSILNEQSRQRVRETIGRIRREHQTPTRGRVVAGLSFGLLARVVRQKEQRLVGVSPAPRLPCRQRRPR